MIPLLYALFPALAAATPLPAGDLTPVGVWQDSSKRVQVEIEPCGERLCGKLVWFKWPDDAQGLPLVDLKNTNPALRTRPLLGLTVLYGLRRSGERTWVDGKLYNPDDGVDYTARLTIRDDGTLGVRGYVLLPIFGRTHIWSRISDISSSPPPSPGGAQAEPAEQPHEQQDEKTKPTTPPRPGNPHRL